MRRPLPCSSRIEKNFSRGASSYDSNAEFQDAVASRLASLVGDSSKLLKVLELGCGTGLLTARIERLLPRASLIACDISPVMLEICASKVRYARLLEHDFEKPFPDTGFDLVISSLAFQWGRSLKEVVANAKRSLKPSGELLFSIPLEGSLAELAEVFETAGVKFPGLPLPTADALKGAIIEVETFSGKPQPLKEALKRLQSLGTLNAGRPLPVKEMRAVLRASANLQIPLNYKVAFCRLGKFA